MPLFEPIQPVQQSVALLEHTPNCLALMDKAAGVCYDRPPRKDIDAKIAFINCVAIKKGHGTLLEHVNFTFEIVCSRATANCITRHRHISFSQESTHFITYKNKIKVCIPGWIRDHYRRIKLWHICSCASANAYFEAIHQGMKAVEARSFLTQDTATKLVATANLREWRHFCKLRLGPENHAEIIPIAAEIVSYLTQTTGLHITYDMPRDYTACIAKLEAEKVAYAMFNELYERLQNGE